MVLVEVSIVLGAVLAGSAAALHFYDRFAKRGFYRQTRDLATRSSEAIRGVLDDIASQIRSANLSVKEATESALESIPSMTPGIQPMGTDAAAQKALTRSLKAAIGTDMLGPYGAVLQEWAPNVHAWLSEHPESVQWALSQPFVQELLRKASGLSSTVVEHKTGGWGP